FLILLGNIVIKAFLFCNLSTFNNFIEKRKKLILALFLILYFTYFMYTGLADYRIFGNFHDLCRNTQIYYTLMKGEFYTSRLHSDTNQKVYSLSCDHFKPSMVFFTPLFLLFPRPETLLFIKTLLMTLGGIPLFLLCMQFIDPLSSLLFTMTSLFVAPFAAQMYTGFHSSDIAPLFIFFTVLFFHKKQFRWFNTFMILTSSIKENLPFMLIMYAPLAFLQKREKKWIIASLLICVLWTAVTFYVIFPKFRVQDSTYGESYPYSRIDKMATYLFGTLLNPAKIISELNQAGRFEYMFLMLAPLLFLLPFFSRYVILSLPGLLSLTVLMNWDTPITFHHPIESTAFLFASSVFVLNNISKFKKIPFIDGKDAVKILCLLMFITIWIQSPIWYGTRKKAPDPHYEYQKELFLVVPNDVTLATPTYLTAFFSARNEVFYLNHDAIKPEVGAEYVIIDLEIVSSPVEDEINKKVKEKGCLDNYDQVWNKGPLYLYKSKR
ncbi:DUF2079 domain-containing protein, partial [bacterium]|nr:DUF2079 domain-containing protein [bacterium]